MSKTNKKLKESQQYVGAARFILMKNEEEFMTKNFQQNFIEKEVGLDYMFFNAKKPRLNKKRL